jgi:hypothetical protein
LEALVKDVEIETSSSQEELELGFWWCHALELFHAGREEAAVRSHQFAGVEEEVATELSMHSSAIFSFSLSN